MLTIMSRLKFVLFSVLMVLCISSCNARKNNTRLVKEIELEVEKMGKQCPISFGLGNDVVLRKIFSKTIRWHIVIVWLISETK